MSARLNSVPLCDLSIQYRRLESQINEAVLRVLSTGQVILGPEVAALEDEVAAYCGSAHAVGCASGTDALSLALHALEIGQGDEVILPPFTFFATAGTIIRAGATPIFVDIDPISYNIDPQKIEEKITPRTKALMIVHLYGQCAEMNEILAISERHGVPVIEDAAQAIGAEYAGRKAGSLGAFGCFSFYPSKNLGAFGDAGMTITSDPRWASRMKSLRVHGMEPKYYHQHVGWNARLDAIQAALLRVKLPYLEEWIEERREAADRYDTLIEEARLGRFLAIPVRQPNRRHTFNQYVVRVADGLRDPLVKHLKAEGIGCEIYYPVPLHLQECLNHLGHTTGEYPLSEEASRTVLAFPMFPEITMDQQRRVVQGCAAFLRQRARLAA